MSRIFLYATGVHTAPDQALCAALSELARRLDVLSREHSWVSVASRTHSLTPTTGVGTLRRGQGGWLAAATAAVETATLPVAPGTDPR